MNFTSKVLTSKKVHSRTCDIDHNLSMSPESKSEIFTLKESFAKSSRGQIAPQKISECIEATLTMPFKEGLNLERKTFEELLLTNQSKGCIHAFFSEKRSSKIPEATKSNPRPLETLGVVGGGTMGSGITIAALNARIPVTMIERDQESIKKVKSFWF